MGVRMTKWLLILIVAIAVLSSVEAESYKCWKKRQKAHQSPMENYLDHMSKQMKREHGIEEEKEPSKEECAKERELDRQTSYRASKPLSISETLYGLFIILIFIGPLGFLIFFVATKYGSVGARPNLYPASSLETDQMLIKGYAAAIKHNDMLRKQREESDRYYKWVQNGCSPRA